MRSKLFAAVVLASTVWASGCQNKDGSPQTEQEKLIQKEKKAKGDIAEAKQAADRKKDQIDSDTAKKVANERENLAKARAELNKNTHTADRPAVKKATGVGGSGAAAVPTTMAMADAEKRADKVIRGTLASAGKTLTLRDANGQEFKLKTDGKTRVLQKGQTVELKDFREGTAVQASYEMNGEDRIARKIEVLGDTAAKK